MIAQSTSALPESAEQIIHRRNARVEFPPHERIPITVEFTPPRTVSAELVSISLASLCLRFSSFMDTGEVNGELRVHFPTLEAGQDSLRCRVVYRRADSEGLWVGLSILASSQRTDQTQDERLTRAVVASMHRLRIAQWLLNRHRQRNKTA